MFTFRSAFDSFNCNSKRMNSNKMNKIHIYEKYNAHEHITNTCIAVYHIARHQQYSDVFRQLFKHIIVI